MKKLLCAMVVGAALAYLFDPQLGPGRREALRAKLDRSGASPPSSIDAVEMIVFDERAPVAAGLS